MSKGATWFIAIMLVIFFAWAYSFEIISEVKTIGYVTTGKNKQIVTHKEGGVINNVYVSEGDIVKKNDLLMVIENLQITERRKKLTEIVDQLKARMSRLEAEIAGKPFTYSGDYSENQFIIESKILASYVDSHKKKIEVLYDQINAQKFALMHLDTEEELLTYEVDLLQDKLNVAEQLFEKGAGSESALINAKIESVRVKNKLNAIYEKLDSAKIHKKELESQVAYEESAYLKDRYEKFDETRFELGQNLVELSTIEARANRQEVLSPMSGTVHELIIETIGAAVRPNQELLAIVPEDNSYIIEARLDLEDRDLVWNGMQARVTPPNNSIYMLAPIISEVYQISADSFYDANTQHTYFKVFISLSPENDDRESLYQGMQVDVRLDTGSHSVLDYLGRPFMRGMNDIMREPLS